MVRWRSALSVAAWMLAVSAAANGADRLEPPPADANSEGRHARSLSLNGRWEYAIGEGHEQAERRAGQAPLAWQPVRL
ncbi:MAG: hypothetical protein JW810_04800, partial [Sedimentisphaerales bacterium]|nr:hypothetical protein [Sedimentisphaerales bacterium]